LLATNDHIVRVRNSSREQSRTRRRFAASCSATATIRPAHRPLERGALGSHTQRPSAPRCKNIGQDHGWKSEVARRLSKPPVSRRCAGRGVGRGRIDKHQPVGGWERAHRTATRTKPRGISRHPRQCRAIGRGQSPDRTDTRTGPGRISARHPRQRHAIGRGQSPDRTAIRTKARRMSGRHPRQCHAIGRGQSPDRTAIRSKPRRISARHPRQCHAIGRGQSPDRTAIRSKRCRMSGRHPRQCHAIGRGQGPDRTATRTKPRRIRGRHRRLHHIIRRGQSPDRTAVCAQASQVIRGRIATRRGGRDAPSDAASLGKRDRSSADIAN
jgi:hypothetical protein